eukprot:CAMPEP_0184542260 /NCGR_PEP_ID=MMETSP0199_2-20130426/1872_1 /TAXON_ID=1112570 /ORGANISM="Thraustochytrium sp., Strain LLF1b" /LENGTH=318 /DNA_ID=CAMNT_0026936031 /DNA_START=137 /DNA_END=1089 /DNA_ORIENTATION=+
MSTAAQMKAFTIAEHGKPEDILQESQLEVPEPKEGQVRVKVQAVSLNPVDYKVMDTPLWPTPLPLTPGYDISGVVDQVASDVTNFKAGDNVFCCNWELDEGQPTGQHGDKFGLIGGGLAEYILLPAVKLSAKPEGVSHEEAAGVSLVGLTALQSLDKAGVTKDSKVLIIGGSSAVGQIAVQLAKERGAWVATTASPRTKDFVTETLKPDLVIDYTAEKWHELDSLKEIDAVLDTVGEADAFKNADAVVKQGGNFVTIGSFDAGFDPKAHQPRFSFAAFYGLKNNTKHQNELAGLIADKKLTVKIDSTYPFTMEGVKSA